MNVLVVGGGAREHAICWALRRELGSGNLFAAPGNSGTAILATNLPIGSDDVERMVSATTTYAIDLVVIGPEAPLAAGLADRIRATGRPVFGPSAEAARIESSKAFAKDVMMKANVPTAPSRTFTELDLALAWIDRQDPPIVVKASGLAAGKGVVICQTKAEAQRAVTGMIRDKAFGEAGRTVIIESFLEGEELSVMAVTNGNDLLLLPPAQDHKRLLEGDKGPNTGGMGAYSPVSIATRILLDKVERTILRPTLDELARRGAPYTGVLYAGLMLDRAGNPKVIEFNCRLGDPEAQTILPRIRSGLLETFHACAVGARLPSLEVLAVGAVTTVVATAGYPNDPRLGDVIEFDPIPESVLIFHGGTQSDQRGALRTNGGRVLSVTGLAEDILEAQKASVAAAEAIRFEGKQFRRDIGWREVKRIRE
jgi:phosphoribosylamine--glycine ligase